MKQTIEKMWFIHFVTLFGVYLCLVCLQVLKKPKYIGKPNKKRCSLPQYQYSIHLSANTAPLS